MPKLDENNPRHDCDIYNESCALFISNGKHKGAIDASSTEELVKAVESNQIIAVELDQDDGFIARVVLGELNEQESSEWIGTCQHRLDLTDGQIVVAGGNAYVSDDYPPEEIDDELDEFFEVISVPPGEYLATVYMQLPFINGFRITRLKEWKGFIPYFQTTRPNDSMPGWLAELADLAGEDLDEEDEDYDEDQEMVAFVIQLKPIGDDDSESKLVDNFFLDSEIRIPPVCPLGIEPVGIERDDEVVDDTDYEEEHRQRFADDDNMADLFRPYGIALYVRRFDDAAQFFVDELKGEIAAYLKSEIETADGGEGEDELDDILAEFGGADGSDAQDGLQPLHEIWLDKEKAKGALSRWKNSFDEGNNRFAPEVADNENYLGDIRCEFGSSDDYIAGKIDIHGIVDSCVVATEAGPKLAGVSFLF